MERFVSVDVGSVLVAYLHPGEVSTTFHDSLVHLLAHDLAGEARVARAGTFGVRVGSGRIAEGRNKAVDAFLAADCAAEWLFWVDTDMGFTADVVDRLLEVADPVGAPIVGALCFAQVEGAVDGRNGFVTAPRPTLFDWVKDSGFQGRRSYPVGAVVRVGGTGSACILIHRSVFERMSVQFGVGQWYSEMRNPYSGDSIAEDLSFCMRAALLDIPVFVHTGVKATHQKTLWLGESHYWAQVVAPPAVERVAVVVPVMRRPQNAAPFMESLRASTGLATVYAVVDDSDETTAVAWREAGAAIVEYADDGGPGTFAEKVNAAYGRSAVMGSAEPWLFVTGDDVRFHPGWLDHAQAAAGELGAKVVGTNDMVNPRVVAGDHATHLLIRREYVEEMGASWDGPGVVCHEGYGHWYVDDEIVSVAKQRGLWGMSLGSRVEHMHPLWNSGVPVDDVYMLGQSRADADRALFVKRVGEFG